MTDPAIAAQLQAKLQVLWEGSKSTILERLDTLNAAQKRLASDPADHKASQSGLEAAHKLAGVLGIFGLPEGSEVASEIEHLFKEHQPLTKTALKKVGQLSERLRSIVAAKG
jgi:HPt (histidine-containing phosphotransfer) domain-containing protein